MVSKTKWTTLKRAIPQIPAFVERCLTGQDSFLVKLVKDRSDFGRIENNFLGRTFKSHTQKLCTPQQINDLPFI